MKIGPLFLGWKKLEESDRILLGLDPWPAGWEVFHIEWNGSGYAICARPRNIGV